MRTKQVEISKEEQEFQKKLDTVVRGYEDRIKRMTAIRDTLRKYRKCSYCGGRYYANGLCVNCYNVMRRVGGDVEEFKALRTRYGYRTNKSENWQETFYRAVFPDVVETPDREVIEDWCDRVIACLRDDDREIVKKIYQDGWSHRGCANLMKRERGWILSRLNSIKTIAKKIKINEGSTNHADN